MKDLFSKQSDGYSKYRPRYPAELFEFITVHVKTRQRAWDCATGNGQAAVVLARYFEEVEATDMSAGQLAKAIQVANVKYTVQPAERSNFPDNHFDLVTVAQALHWFEFDAFYKELKRVLKPGAWFATWVYALLKIDPEIDEIIDQRLYRDLLDDYWDPERKHVDEYYINIPFPLREIETPLFTSEFEWSLEELVGYFNTWSAVQKFIFQNNYNPVDQIIPLLTAKWKTPLMKVRFPIRLRMGQVEK